jgi:hypothetical protein
MQIQSTTSVFPTTDACRSQQMALLSALGGSGRALRRDECGDWAIIGKRGSIHTWGDGKTWVLYTACDSPRHWTATKKRLAFCEVRQDGDDEGCFRLHQLPSREQAAAIRRAVGIYKRREVSLSVLERLKAFAFERRPRREARN